MFCDEMCVETVLVLSLFTLVFYVNGLEDTIHFAQKVEVSQGYSTEPFVRGIFVNTSITQCIILCKSKGGCDFINYNTRAHVCYILTSEVPVNIIADDSHVYGMKSEFNTVSVALNIMYE